MRAETKVILVDFHAEATSEKIAMGRWLDGQVSAVIGTHTHVQTADEMIFPGGTAYLTDAGMCGPIHSVIGSEIDPVLHRFASNLPTKNHVARGDVAVRGVVVEVDPAIRARAGDRAGGGDRCHSDVKRAEREPPAPADGYELLDSGGFQKLERFGSVTLARPCAQAIWRPRLPEARWRQATARFTREGQKTRWAGREALPKKWDIVGRWSEASG